MRSVDAKLALSIFPNFEKKNKNFSFVSNAGNGVPFLFPHVKYIEELSLIHI